MVISFYTKTKSDRQQKLNLRRQTEMRGKTENTTVFIWLTFEGTLRTAEANEQLI